MQFILICESMPKKRRKGKVEGNKKFKNKLQTLLKYANIDTAQ